ncbi:unnamed protein product [Brassica oleracea var. botrytis]
MVMSDLPPDLVEEILSRVPATSLKPLRSSCKQWNTLFKDPRFAKKNFGETRWIQYEDSIFALGYVNTKSGRSYKIIRCWKRYRYSCCETNGPVVETYEFSSDSWRVLDDVTLDELLEKKNSHCYIHLSKFTSKMDMWVTIDTDTKAALRWRKSFTVDEPDYVPLPMSFLLDEDKEVALFCACSEVSYIYNNPLTWQGFLLGIREEGLLVSSSHFKRKHIYHALRYADK